MSRIFRLIPVLLTAVVAQAATLQQLSMDQMSQLATSVVRARVIGSSASFFQSPGSPAIYTHYTLSVSEIWKGATVTEVMLPGGDVNGQKQSFPGVPELKVGAEYILFLWKSPATGIVHPMGLTQGIFAVTAQTSGSVTAVRQKSGELMLDASGHRVVDQPMTVNISDMRSRVRRGSGPISTTGAAK